MRDQVCVICSESTEGSQLVQPEGVRKVLSSLKGWIGILLVKKGDIWYSERRVQHEKRMNREPPVADIEVWSVGRDEVGAGRASAGNRRCAKGHFPSFLPSLLPQGAIESSIFFVGKWHVGFYLKEIILHVEELGLGTGRRKCKVLLDLRCVTSACIRA